MGGDTPVYNAKNILEVPLEVTTFFLSPKCETTTNQQRNGKQTRNNAYKINISLCLYLLHCHSLMLSFLMSTKAGQFIKSYKVM